MNVKALLSAGIFFVIGFFIPKEATAFDLAGVTRLSTQNADVPNPNIVDPPKRQVK